LGIVNTADQRKVTPVPSGIATRRLTATSGFTALLWPLTTATKTTIRTATDFKRSS
jgi:hypothetical protein